MIIKDEKEKEINIKNNKDNEQFINNKKEGTSFLENYSGEEEDEDDLLKSDIEDNKSNDLYIFSSKTNHKLNDAFIILNKTEDNIKKQNNEIHNSDNMNKDSRNETDDLLSSLQQLQQKKSLSNNDEEDENEDEEEDDEDIEISEDSESESINPYNNYIKSYTKINDIFDKLGKRKSIYEKETNKIYFYLFKLFQRDGLYLCVNLQYSNKNKWNDIINNILVKKYFVENKETHINLDNVLNKIIGDINQKEILDIKNNDFHLRNEAIIINKDNFNRYSFFIKAKIYYLNFLNKQYTFNVMVNINWTIKYFIKYFSTLYHIPIEESSDKPILSLFINDKPLPQKEINNSKNNNYIFSPTNFNPQKDYMLIIEQKSLDDINIDLGSNNSKYNFNGDKVPHIVFSSHNNFIVESIIVSNKLELLDCQVYVFKDEYYFNLERNVGKYNFKKAKNILSSPDWKNKCKYVTSIKSVNSSPYKNNEDAKSFLIYPHLILQHDKSYVFLINSPNFNINVFSSGSGDQGLFIISIDDKSILNGIICKKISDLSLK